MSYGSGSLFQRGKKGIWYYQAWVDGVQVGPFSARTTDRKEAQRKLDRLLGQRARGELAYHKLKSAKGTLGQILDDYIAHAKDNLDPNTAYIYRATIEANMRKPFGDLNPIQLTTERLKEYRANRKAEGAAESSINRELTYLRAALRFAVKSGTPLPIPWFPMVNEKKFARQGYREEEDFLKFLDALDDDMKPFACGAYYGGLRRGELVKLDLSDIDIENRSITVRFGKNGETRSVPIFDGPMLQWFEWIFDHCKPGQTKAFVYANGREITERNFYDRWHEAAQKSGIGYFIPHDSRRSSNRRLSREGVPQALRMKLHGWKTADMDRRYGVVDRADADAVRKLMNSKRLTTAKTTVKTKAKESR
jgi:integrase